MDINNKTKNETRTQLHTEEQGISGNILVVRLQVGLDIKV